MFVGLAEPDRERCIDTLLKNGISVRLAGRGWAEFVSKRSHDSRLTFAGDAVFGDDYASLVSHAWVGLGLLSKRFPELHTTRTFEIPACGAILATKRTADTEQFFSDSEAIFFEDYADLAKKLRTLMETPGDEVLASVAHAGMKRVSIDGRNYSTILAQILADERLT